VNDKLSRNPIVVVVVVVVVVVIGETTRLGVRENPGRYANLDYDNDNDIGARSIP
jgi:hypothetical protein